MSPEHPSASTLEQYAPRLTAVTGPPKELGSVAVEQVMARIAAAADGAPHPQDGLLLLSPELVIRESTAPAPRCRTDQ